MEKENLKLFEKKLDRLLNKLAMLGLKPTIYDTELIVNDNNELIPEQSSPCISMILETRGLDKWCIGIWGTGQWGDWYAVEEESMFTVFLIHKWQFDKFRPSSADVCYSFPANPEENDMTGMILDLLEMKKHPKETYEKMFGRSYFKDYWWNEIQNPVQKWLKYKGSVNFIYGILKFISWFDPRVQSKRTLYKKTEGRIPSVHIGFLATKKCSENDKSFERFYKLYSGLPRKLRYWTKGKLFDAHFNVSDYEESMTNEEIRIRLMKGVVL